jgi:hypothetical protein
MRGLVLCGMLLSLVTTLSACGRNCESFCDKPCNGVTTADCKASCIKLDALNKVAKCDEKWSDFYSCAGGLSDADRCSSNNTLCKTEGNAAMACVANYCLSNPATPECK